MMYEPLALTDVCKGTFGCVCSGCQDTLPAHLCLQKKGSVKQVKLMPISSYQLLFRIIIAVHQIGRAYNSNVLHFDLPQKACQRLFVTVVSTNMNASTINIINPPKTNQIQTLLEKYDRKYGDKQRAHHYCAYVAPVARNRATFLVMESTWRLSQRWSSLNPHDGPL